MKKMLLILLCLFSQLAFAQQNKLKNKPNSNDNNKLFPSQQLSKWSVGLGVGGTYTIFDINQDIVNPIYALNLKYSLGHVVSLRLHGAYGTYSGRNTDGLKKDYGFVNNISQLGLNVLANLGGLNFRKKNPNTVFYVFTGFNLVFSDGLRDNKTTALARTYFGNDYSIPLGLGMKYKINNMFDAGIEGVINATASDNFDLYNPYPNQGFPDLFGSFMFTVGYNFTGAKRTEHIDWANPITAIYDDLAKKSQKAANDLKNDGDGDGIPDYLDLEPNTKKGYKVDVKGVTMDSDGDGIPDTEDADPYGFNQMLSIYYPAETFQVKSAVDVMKFSDSIPQADFITLSTEGYGLPIITFAPNKYDVHVEQYPLLQQIARIMTVDTTVSVAVIGHADNNKPDMTQLTIAEKRALAVKRQLMKIYELDSERILIFSERDTFVKKYKLQTEGLDRKVEFRLIRKQ